MNYKKMNYCMDVLKREVPAFYEMYKKTPLQDVNIEGICFWAEFLTKLNEEK